MDLNSLDGVDKELRRLYTIYRKTGWPEIQACIMKVSRIRRQLANGWKARDTG